MRTVREYEHCMLQPGQELDELVVTAVFETVPRRRAAVLTADGHGIAAEVNESQGPWYYEAGLAQWLVEEQQAGRHMEHRMGYLQGDQYYSRHWSSVEQVIEKLEKLGAKLIIGRNWSSDGTQPTALFVTEPLETMPPSAGGSYPHAICLAAVNWMRGCGPEVERWKVLDANPAGVRTKMIVTARGKVALQCGQSQAAEALVEEHNRRARVIVTA